MPTILCRDAKSQLWPLVRRDFGKPFLDPTGGDRPLLQRTLACLDESDGDRPVVIAEVRTQFDVLDQAAAVGRDLDLVLVPEERGELAAITLAALLAARRDPNATVLVMPADHAFAPGGALRATLERAAGIAAAGDPVVVATAPDRPALGRSYVAPGVEIEPGHHRLARIAEPQDAHQAAELVAAGWLWNSGILCFRADVVLRLVEAMEPATLAVVGDALAAATPGTGALHLGDGFRDAVPARFDHAILARTDLTTVLAGTFAWSALGTWQEVWQQAPKDERGLVHTGPAVVEGSRDSYVRADRRLVCALGVEGLVVIDTADAVLVAPLDRAAEIGDLVDRLAAEGRSEAILPARVRRPWGWYQTLELGTRFRVKRLHVYPGKRLSRQKHLHRAEHWVVVRGTAEVTRDDAVHLLTEGEAIELPLGCIHRVGNPGKVPVEIIETQIGAYLEEDDIIRFDDDFGRS